VKILDNDQSVLENLHTAYFFKIMQKVIINSDIISYFDEAKFKYTSEFK